MFLSSLVFLTSPAVALSYTSSLLTSVTSPRVLSSAVMSPGGNVCFSTYDTSSTSTLSYWSPGDARPTTVRSVRYSVGADRCADVSDSGYVTGYRSTTSRSSGFLWDDATATTVNLTSGTASTRPYAVTESGGVLGAAITFGSYYPIGWSSAGVATALSSDAGNSASIVGAADEVGYYWTYARAGSSYVYDIGGYDFLTGTNTRVVDDFADLLAVTLAEDGTLYLKDSASTLTAYGTDGSEVAVDLTDGLYGTVLQTNGVGQAVVSGYHTDYSEALWCWSADVGSVDLDLDGLLYASVMSVNDAGQAVGQGFDDTTFAIRSFQWDCATGDRTELDVPSGQISGGPTLITEDGEVIFTFTNSSSRTTVWVWDPVTDTTTQLLTTDSGRHTITTADQASGDLLITSMNGSRYRLFHLAQGS